MNLIDFSESPTALITWYTPFSSTYNWAACERQRRRALSTMIVMTASGSADEWTKADSTSFAASNCSASSAEVPLETLISRHTDGRP